MKQYDRRPKTRRIIAFVMLFSCVWTSGLAETVQERVVLGLPQIIRMAVAISPEMAEKRSEIASSRSDLAQAEAAYYPQLDSVAIVGPVENARRPAVSGSRIIDPSPDLAIGIFGRLSFILTQPLYTFGKISNRKEAARQGVMAKELKQAQTGNEIALRVKQLYFALVLARAGIEVAKEADGFFADARKRMARLLELGSSNVAESDLHRVDAYRANVVRGLAEAEKGAQIAYFALKSLIGMPQGQDFVPAETSLSIRDGQMDLAEMYVKRALADRPEFKQLEHALTAQKFLVDAARSDRYPTFFGAAAGSFAGAPGRQAFHNPYIFDDFNHVIGGVVSGMSWHFDFGIARAKVEKESAEYDRLSHTRATARLNIPIEVMKHYQDIIQWKAAAKAYMKGSEASRQWVVSALTSFDMGTGSADDLLRSIERYGENQGKYLESLFNYNVSLAELDYATGVRAW